MTLDGKTIADTEYDVTYSSNINKGTATVTVTGKNNYTGSKAGTFKILARISKSVMFQTLRMLFITVRHRPLR